MRVLLDECLPRKLAREIQGHEVRTVPGMGWAGTKNGALLKLASTRFDVFITIDRGIRFQQNLSALTRGTPLGVILLRATSNRLASLLPLVPRVHGAITQLAPGQVISVAPTAE